MYTTRQAPYCLVSIFATPWNWRLLAPTGAVATALPNPSVKTSPRGLRQCRLRLVWADSCGGVSNSIVSSLVHIFPFFLVLCLCCTPFPPPASIVNGRPRLAIFPLPLHLFGDAILALPLPCLCQSGTMPSSPCSCLVDTIFASALSPPPPRYPYLLAIAFDVRFSRCSHPLLPSLPTLMLMSY